MDSDAVLRELGLSDNEVDIYLILLRMEKCSAADISKLTRISRPHIYDTLNKLIEKGLASHITVNKKKYFIAASPNRLIEMVRDKERDLLSIIPALMAQDREEGQSPLVEVYEGRQGLKTIFNEILEQEKEWLCWGGTGKIPTILPDFITGWHTKRVRLGITIRAVFDDTMQGRKRGGEFEKMGLARSRYLRKEDALPVSIYISGRKTMIVFVSVEKPFVISIDSREIADSFTSYFNMIWGMARK